MKRYGYLDMPEGYSSDIADWKVTAKGRCPVCQKVNRKVVIAEDLGGLMPDENSVYPADDVFVCGTCAL